MTTAPTTPVKVASEVCVQAGVAEMEGKLERAVRDISLEIRAEIRETRVEMREIRTENQRLIRWVIGVGVVLVLAVLVRPSFG